MFPLLSKEDEYLRYMFSRSLTGGASIVFTRYAKKGESQIHPDSPIKTSSFASYDANCLYLSMFTSSFPSFHYIIRREDDGYKPRSRTRQIKMYAWMHYISEVDGFYIKNVATEGQEVAVGPYVTDGMYIKDNGDVVVTECKGCYHHAHNAPWCKVGAKARNPEEIRQRDACRQEYLQQRVSRIRVTWECDFDRTLAHVPLVQQYMNKFTPPFYKKCPHEVDKDILISEIKSGLFMNMRL